MLGAFASVMLGGPQIARAQSPGRLRRIGGVYGITLSRNEGFLEGRRDHGWIDGQNVTVEIRQRDEEIAQLVGLSLPPSLLARATEVLQ